jgi:hypothetical protein
LVGLDQRHGLGHQCPDLFQVTTPQLQLGETGEQRAGHLGLGGLGKVVEQAAALVGASTAGAASQWQPRGWGR